MNIKVLAGSGIAIGALAVGMLAGSVVGTGGASAQTPAAVSSVAAAPAARVAQVAQQAVVSSDVASAQAAQAAATSTPSTTQPAQPSQPAPKSSGSVTAKITRQQAEQAALAASPGNTIDHTSLQDQNGTAVYDVDFANGGGVLVNGDTGAVISVEAAGQDKGGPGGPGGPGGRGGADQAALAAKATVTQQQAEQAALAASPGNTVDHSRLAGDPNGVVFWDVDFANGGGVTVNAQTGAVIATEAAGTDHGGPGGHR